MYTINIRFDAEADVWVAVSDDVPGLATEAESLDALESKLHALVPELLEANALPATGTYSLRIDCPIAA
ncbi:DUF1902 domain-containing protein [Algiphilus sp.]|uniref:DUF1902 domain-containing protein n=1 Tax=Algiphilus sp. TaxID=1872431 RepID=UPI0025C19AA3|nr:DUF1902 domain-containing protein [Algiphilus sp.]MCK5772053.1 DUF1902 domain-containing protein [Algiphilus sp.]